MLSLKSVSIALVAALFAGAALAESTPMCPAKLGADGKCGTPCKTNGQLECSASRDKILKCQPENNGGWMQQTSCDGQAVCMTGKDGTPYCGKKKTVRADRF